MKAVSVVPGAQGSADLRDVPDVPGPEQGLLIETTAVGVCGTDREILQGMYGEAPAGEERLIIGHESLGRVIDAAGSPFSVGDHVVGIVRRPDPVPCACCARGEWDMCSNGRYTERGIKGLHGYACERFLIEPDFAVAVDPGLGIVGVLVEPASIVAKAWRRIEASTAFCSEPKTVLVTGAGAIGLLAALMGVQRGFDVHVLDRVESGAKPSLVADLGATYHASTPARACPGADISVECTGSNQLLFDVIKNAGRNGVVCLAGVSSPGGEEVVDAGAINREIVLENNVVFGTVNANRGDYVTASRSLSAADRGWLDRLITRRVPLEHWSDAYAPQESDVKRVLLFA